MDDLRARLLNRVLTWDDLEGASHLVWGGDDTNSLIFGTCKCSDCHGDTLDMEVGGRAASWGIWCGIQRQNHSLEDMGRFAVNGILRAYEQRAQDDLRTARGWV